MDESLPLFVPHHEGDMAPPPYWRVECIGLALITNYITEQLVVVPGDDERAKLLAFASRANKARPGPQLVTFRGRGFDAPVLDARCMRYGIPLTYLHSPRMDHRYSMGGHFDLADHLNVFGAARAAKLDVWAKLIGLPGKLGTSGSDVNALIAEGKRREVELYCLCDVAQTVGLWLRVLLVRGVIAPEMYVTAARSLLDVIEKTNGLEQLAAAIDRPRFLLEESECPK